MASLISTQYFKNASSVNSTTNRLSPWDLLERLLKDLHQCERASQQMRLLLQAIRSSMQADAVYLYPGKSREPFEVVADAGLTPEWCRAYTEMLLRRTPGVGSQLIRCDLKLRPPASAREVQSVAMVCMSKSKSMWIVALSFSPQRKFGPTDTQLMSLARQMLLSHSRHVRLSESLKETLHGMVHCLTATIDAKDPYTCGHSERVARIGVRLGQQMQLSSSIVSDIYLAGLLHDIGKIATPDTLLGKPDELTDTEFHEIQKHPVAGDRIVSQIKQLAHLRPGVRNHHERFDGRGYPDRLNGEGIPLLARLLAVADSCDAMMSNRPYRPALPPERIERIMREGAGSQWDPEIITHFMACRQELYPICQQGIGESVYAAIERVAKVQDDASAQHSQLNLRDLEPRSCHTSPLMFQQ